MTLDMFHLSRGDYAQDWQVRSLRSMLVARSERNRVDLPLLSVARERGVFVRSVEDANHNAIPDDLSNYKVAREGDLVINKMKAWQGSLGLAPVDGIVSPAYFVFKADFSVPRFGEYLLRSKPYVARFAAASDGIRIGQWDLNVPRMRNIEVWLPPADEQAAIVKYLAHANARIDKTIVAKRRLIALLEEQGRCLANHVVTHGADYEARTSSGVSWLGDIPSGWDVAPLKRYWSVTDCKHLTVPFTDEGFPVASVSQAQRFTLDLSDSKLTDADSYERLIEGGRKPRRGDLIYCRNVGVGNAAVVETDEQFAMGQDVCLLRSESQNPYFLNHFLRSNAMRVQLEALLVGSTFRRINVEDVRSLVIVVPPIEEQARLVARVNDELVPISVATGKLGREIMLLQEFRSRLVADVVTGQVDVRAIAATLPDTPEATAEALEEDVPQLDEGLGDTAEGDVE